MKRIALLPLASLALSMFSAGCGSSTSSTPAATPITAPQLSLSSSALNFGTATVGQAAAPQTLTVTSSGTAAVAFSTFTLSDTTDYTVTNTCGTTLAPSASCTVSVGFKPLTAAALPATLTLTSNAGSATVAITGAGTAAAMAILNVTPTAFTFPSTVAGQTSDPQSATISNSGTAPLTFTSITVADPVNYSLASTCGTTLAPAATCTLTFAFQPQTASVAPTTVSIVSPNTIAPVITLSGTAAPVPSIALALSATALTFPATTVGQSSSAQVLTLTSTGNTAVTLTGTRLSDPADYALMSTCGTTLAPAATCTLVVTFTPQTVATLPSILTLADNATSAPQTVTLAGTGTAVPAPVATLSSTNLIFPGDPAGVVETLLPPLTLTNTGTAPLVITSFSVTPLSGPFSQRGNCIGTLAPGASCSSTFSFYPKTAATLYVGQVLISDNAGSGSQVVMLSGTSSGAPPAAVLSASSLSFPNTNVGSSSAVQTVTLTNPGSLNLTGVSIASLGSPAFTSTNNCATVVNAAGSCTINVTFTPTTTGSATATLSISDNASNSPQTITLSGTGTAPLATLSAPSVAFPNTAPGSTGAASNVTLTNAGSGPLTLSSIALGGTNPTAFAFTTTCGSTLPAGASCPISATFSPAAAQSYSATITLTDNAASSPTQTIALTGTGVASGTVTRTFLVEPDQGFQTLYNMVNSTTKSVDMVMYALVDTTFTGDLVAACNRGVRVRVILDQNNEKSRNAPALNQINSAGPNCSAVYANPTYAVTHQKSIVFDGTQVAIMTLNLENISNYYAETRDFAVIENDPVDIAAIQATFNADYVYSTYTPAAGTDLIWSPTTATSSLLGIINNATATLLVENEEMSAPNIVSALEAACQRGVVTHIAMTNTGSYAANFRALESAGCGVHLFADNSTTLYIHAKAIVADYGTPAQTAYVGSINFSTASLTQNRELGLFLSDPAILQTLTTTINTDYANAPPF